jgi:signal transduction histidine kinase
VSHELKTPLNTIVGFSEILTESPDAAEASGFARRIHDSALQLQEMVDSLLDVARSEAGDLAAAHALVDLPAAMRGVLATHRRDAEARGISLDLRCELPEGKTVVASVDRVAFVHLFGNVLSAILRTAPGGDVQLVAREAQGSFLVEVASGAGVQERLRVTHSGELALALGASITFRDGPGPDSRLTLRLPRVRLSQSIA